MDLFLEIFFSFALIGLICISYAYFIEPKKLIVRKQCFSSAKKFRVVHFSDTHFGKHYKKENLLKLVSKINEQKADFVFFTGDFFNGYINNFEKDEKDYYVEQLSKIKAEKYAVLGNHDYKTTDRCVHTLLQKSGFTVLKDENIYNKKFNVKITGFCDFKSCEMNIDYYKSLNNEFFNLILMHEGDYVNLFPEKIKGMVFSGHSHGGQVSLPFLTKFFLPIGGEKYIKGFYKTKNANLFVSSGVGLTGLPLRFLNTPEIVVFDFNDEK